MAISVERYERLLKVAEQARREQDRAAGTIEHIKKAIKEEFDCDSLEELEAWIVKHKKIHAKKEKALEEKVAAYEKEYADELGSTEDDD